MGRKTNEAGEPVEPGEYTDSREVCATCDGTGTATERIAGIAGVGGGFRVRACPSCTPEPAPFVPACTLCDDTGETKREVVDGDLCITRCPCTRDLAEACRMCEDDGDPNGRLACPECGACFGCAQDDCATCLVRRDFLQFERGLPQHHGSGLRKGQP